MSFCGGYNRPSKIVSECQQVDLTIPAIKTTWPQGKHPHGLLGGGLKALENLFLGFGNELMRAGAEPMEPGFDMLYEIPGQDVWPRIKLSWPTYSMSRTLIERTLRRQVERIGNIKVRRGCRVLNIVSEAHVLAATGIRYEAPEAEKENQQNRLITISKTDTERNCKEWYAGQ